MNKAELKKKLEKVVIEGFNIENAPPLPIGNYIAVKKVGNFAFVSGQLPKKNNGDIITIDKIKEDEEVKNAVRLSLANALHQLIFDKKINNIKSIIRIDGYFNQMEGNKTPDFLDEASNLIADLFEKEDKDHARSVFTVSNLPLDSILELVIIAEIN